MSKYQSYYDVAVKSDDKLITVGELYPIHRVMDSAGAPRKAE